MKLMHSPRRRNEDFIKLVVVNDSFSEENIQVSKDWHFSENENFIDLQGNARCIPEIFCINNKLILRMKMDQFRSLCKEMNFLWI